MRTLVAALGLLVAAVIGASQSWSAASFPIPGPSATDRALAEKVQNQSCRAWRRQCARQFGWRGKRYRRCVAWHGC